MGKPKIVDLEICEDGTYSPKQTKSSTKAVTKTVHKEKSSKPRHIVPSGVDEFFEGIDIGLDLLDAVKIRTMRVMGLRD